MRMKHSFWLLFAVLASLAPDRAVAAPQILAVLASDVGSPFACDDGLCQADLSTFCLQRHRPAPAYGTVYDPAAPGAFTLVLRSAEGVERRVAAADHVTFVQHRGFTAVSARVPAQLLADQGAVSAALQVGPDAVLLPRPIAGDPDPLSAEEIAFAAGPLRALGTRIVDASPAGATARLVSTLINLLPPEGRVAVTRRTALWGEMLGTGAPGRGDGAVLSRTRAEYDLCLEAIAAPRVVSLRSCLEMGHGRLMRDLNGAYWDAEVGS